MPMDFSEPSPQQDTAARGAGIRHLRNLQEIGRAVGSDMDPKDLLRLILESIIHITRATGGSLMLIDNPEGVLRVEVAAGFAGERIYDTRLRVGQGVTGWVAAHGRPLRVADTRADERYHEVQPDIRSELAVPLIVAGGTIGVISVDSTREGAFTAEDEAIMVSLAGQSAKVIQNSLLHEEIRHKAAALEMLGRVTATVAGTLELDRVLEEVVRQAAKLIGAKLVSLMLIDPADRTLTIRAMHGAVADYRDRPPLPLDGSLTGDVILRGEPMTVLDVRAAPGFKMLDLAEREGLVSLLSVPLLWREKAIGALNIYTSEPYAFSDEEVGLMSSLAMHSAIAIENARLHYETRRSEEALRSADRLAVLGELAAGVAHEIRNPLASINVILHGFSKELNLEGRHAEDLEMLKRQVDRLDQIVERFLDIARKRPGKTKKAVRIADAVAETSLLLQHPVASRGVQLWADIPPDLPDWMGDPVELGQIFYNLALNAVQAVEEGGEVVITARRDGPGDPSGHASVRIEIADNGPGLPDAVRRKLFQPFVTTKEDGVGLGLSIVHRLVLRAGGSVEADERAGGGTVFRVCLPLPDADA